MLNRFFIIISLIVFPAAAQNINSYVDLERSIGEILLSKNYITQKEFDLNMGFLIYGLHQRNINKENLKDGIYGISSGNHRPINFCIYNNREVQFLDLNTFDNLLNSLDSVIRYSIKENYCRELVLHYTKSLIYMHFNRNRNLSVYERRDDNLLQLSKNEYGIIQLKKEMAKEIARQEIIHYESIETDDIFFGYLDMCSGNISENDKLDEGIYSYSYLRSENFTTHYLILENNTVVHLEMQNENQFIKSVQETIKWCERKNIGLTKINWFIEKVFKKYLHESCLNLITQDLP